jgi:hypothetical protein
VTPGYFPLVLYKGDTYRWQFSLWLDTLMTQAADLTGCTALSEIRDKPGGSIVIATIACTITLPNIINGVLDAADSALLPSSAAWDLQVTYPSGDVATVLAGVVSTQADVTGAVPPEVPPVVTPSVMPRVVRGGRR